MLILIYHYVEIIVELFLPSICSYNIYDLQNIFPGEPVYIHMQSLINIIQENNSVSYHLKKRKGKLPLLCGSREVLIPFYDTY